NGAAALVVAVLGWDRTGDDACAGWDAWVVLDRIGQQTGPPVRGFSARRSLRECRCSLGHLMGLIVALGATQGAAPPEDGDLAVLQERAVRRVLGDHLRPGRRLTDLRVHVIRHRLDRRAAVDIA